VCDSLSPSLTLSRSPSAVRDGWTARDFHSKCDGKGATLTLVRSKEGYVFGGYTAVPWTSPSDYGTCVRVCVSVCTHVCVSSVHMPDPHAFIYTLTNNAGLPAYKAKATKQLQYAVWHNSGRLLFGYAGDLAICSNAHTAAGSYTEWGSTYPLPPGATRDFLVGGRNFKVAALEVFLVQ
jgi:BTB/POZ domain-containing protein KCTD9